MDQSKIKQIKALIKKDRASYAYFFNRLKTSSWIIPLLNEGFFQKPDPPIRDGNYISFPNWPEIDYLLRVVDESQDDVAAALKVIPDTDNQRVANEFVQILLKLDSGKSVQFIEQVVRFVNIPYPLHVHIHAADLAVKLIKDGYVNPAIKITEELLDVQPDPKAAKLSDKELSMIFIEPQIKYRDYDYQKIIETVAPTISSIAPTKGADLFTNLLEKAINYKLIKDAGDASDDEGPWEDYSNIWRPDIATDRHIQDQPRQGLIAALRDSLIGLMQSTELSETEKLDVLNRVATKRYKVFGRVVEYVLRDYKDRPTFKSLYEKLYQDVAPIVDAAVLAHNPSLFTPDAGITFDDLASLSDDKLIEKLKIYAPDPNKHFHWRDEMADLVTALIKSDIKRYVKLADQFASLKMQYVHSLLSAVDEKLEELDGDEIVKVLTLGETFLSDSDTSNGQYGEWSRMALTRLLYKLTHQRKDKGEYLPKKAAALALKLIKTLCRDDNPTPEHEQQYGGDNRDPASLSLNTVRGESMHALAHFALWVRRNKLDDELIGTIYDEFEWHLDPSNDPSLTARSVYGYELPWIWVANKKWVQKNLARIFTDDERGNAAWEAYISLNQAWTDLLPMLKPMFTEKITNLATYQDKANSSKDANKQFVHHIMLYYWNGQLSLEEAELVVRFFTTADVHYRTEALHFIGFELRKHGKKIEKGILNRLHKLWEYRLNDVSANPSRGTAELEEFGSWFSSGAFDEKWALNNLQQILNITHNTNPDFLVLGKLSELCKLYPLQTVQCLKDLIVDPREKWSIDSWRAEAFSIINTAYQSKDVSARKIAEDVTDILVAKGYHFFRDAIK